MNGGSGGSSSGGEGSGGGLLVDGGGVWVRFSPSSLSTTTASPALSSPGEWTTALDWASMKEALHVPTLVRRIDDAGHDDNGDDGDGGEEDGGRSGKTQ